MIYLLFIITILVIITQTINTYYVFNAFSRIENAKLKLFQSIVFCSILSLAVFAFVITGYTRLAIIGALIEIIINFYYYPASFWQEGFKAIPGKKNEIAPKRFLSILKFWRQNWIAFVFSIFIPALIYILAELIKNFR